MPSAARAGTRQATDGDADTLAPCGWRRLASDSGSSLGTRGSSRWVVRLALMTGQGLTARQRRAWRHAASAGRANLAGRRLPSNKASHDYYDVRLGPYVSRSGAEALVRRKDYVSGAAPALNLCLEQARALPMTRRAWARGFGAERPPQPVVLRTVLGLNEPPIVASGTLPPLRAQAGG